MNSKFVTRIIAYMLIYIGLPAIAVMLNHGLVCPVVFTVYIFVLIPFGILRMIDFYRTNEGTTMLMRVFNALFRVPLALFGLLSLVIGVSIICWVLYNILVERQKEYSGPRFLAGWRSFGIGVPLVLFGWSILRSVLHRKEPVALAPEEESECEHEGGDG
jgi:hypothetical protein